MACFNPETEEFQSVCRVMSGFSDAFYIEVMKSSTTLSHFSFRPTFDDNIFMNSNIVTNGGHLVYGFGFVSFVEAETSRTHL